MKYIYWPNLIKDINIKDIKRTLILGQYNISIFIIKLYFILFYIS